MSQSYAVDFHIHSTFSAATSGRMIFDKIGEQAEIKGLDFVGTGDILNPKWMSLLREELEEIEEGTYKYPSYDTRFILTAEVEDRNRVHHLILFPSITKVLDFRGELGKYSSDINIDGRPSFDLGAPELVEVASDLDCLIGPCHAFTPWTSIYKEFDTLADCYGDQTKNVNFLELGLSADTYMADRIEELHDLPFLSNSDAHSPWPNKLGREFNRFELSEPLSAKIFESIAKKRNITLNVGLNPKLGKYHLTACSSCHERYSIEDAKKLHWRCEKCGDSIKKGVSDRINELADFDSPVSPSFRPEYVHTAPLSEVISIGLNSRSPRTAEVQNFWRILIEEFGDEISVLIDADISEISKISNKKISVVIKSFREGSLRIYPGGGGEYGKLEISSEFTKSGKRRIQKTLSDFGG